MQWLKKILEKFSSTAYPEFELAPRDAYWVMSALSAMVRKPTPAQTAFPAAVPLVNLVKMAKEYGWQFEEIPASAVFDEAKCPPDTRFVFFKAESAPGTDSTTGAEASEVTSGASAAERVAVSSDDAVEIAPPAYVGVRPFVLLGMKGEQCLVAEAGAPQPGVKSVAELRALLDGATVFKLILEEKLPQEDLEVFGWRWFATAFFQRKTVVRDVLLGSLFVQLIGLGYPLATQAIVDKVIQNQAVNTLIALGIGIALLAFGSAALSWLRQKFLLRMANLVDGELASEVLARLLRLPIRYFEARATGVIINRIHGVERVREFFAGTFTLVALELPFALLFLILMVTYSWQLSVLVGVFVAGMVGASFAVGPTLRNRVNQQSQLGAKVQGYLTEHVAATETLKSLQMENQVVGRFQQMNRAYLESVRQTRELGNAYGTGMQFAEQLMNALVLCIGAYLAMTTSELTIGMLVAFQMFAQRVSQPLLKLSGAWQEFQQVRVAVKQLGDVMNAPVEKYSEMVTSSPAVKGRLEVEGLGFQHSPDRPMLYENLSFTIEPGQVVLVTGPSGCGKSTLAKILLGLYGDYKGTVRIDGRDIRSMTVNEIRQFFGVVPQETVLFSGTIADNLLNAVPHVPFERAVDACKWAGVHDAVENLPKGYLTEIGERGVGLSGGQRQRIGIARALLKQPRLFIFDEATSGLDSASAELIAETVNQLRGKATVVFIAHKVPANLVFDSKIILTKEGSLNESSR